MRAPAGCPLRVALVAGEHSGDQLGFKLMRALREARAGEIEFFGVGGEAMEAEGLKSLFPISDIAVMGILPVMAKLPTLIARIRQTAAGDRRRHARRARHHRQPRLHPSRRAPRARGAAELPIVDYVSPSVWAWRPGRAKAMRAYVDCVLALLPFEPGAYRRLGGPRCVYVGHPLIERLGELRPNADEARRPRLRAAAHRRPAGLAPLRNDPADGRFRRRAARFATVGPFEVVLPTLPHVESEVRAAARLAEPPTIVLGEAAKSRRVSRRARGLADSGTGTLELALAGVPMVGAYKVSRIEEPLKYLVNVPSILLPNLILGERAIPEKLQRECTPATLARRWRRSCATARRVRASSRRSHGSTRSWRCLTAARPAPTPRAQSWRRSRRARRRPQMN